ncbi:MAG TPA: DUF6249 domain-containing protein [Prevotella sp.]
MKKFLIAWALVFFCSAVAADAAPKHRHHQQVTAIDSSKSKQNEGIEAYSDTTSVGAADMEDTLYTVDDAMTGSYDPADYDDPIDYFLNSPAWGVGGILIAILVVVLLLLFLLAPFIILIMLIRFLIKRHNDKVMLAQKAMETGQPLPDAKPEMPKNTNEYYRVKGIKNFFLGIGLMFLFWLLGAEELAGIGILVACMGAGQWVISRNKSKETNEDNPQF